MTDQPVVPPQGKPPRLTSPQADALLAAAYGSLRVYRGWSERPVVTADPMGTGGCPVLAQPEGTVRALARLGMLEIPDLPEGFEGQKGLVLSLTDRGRDRLFALFPPERLAAVQEWKDRERRDKERDEAAALHRQAMNPPGQRERLDAARAAADANRRAMQAAREAHSAIAYRLGEGANDVDGLLAELRDTTRLIRALEAESVDLARHAEEDRRQLKEKADAAVQARFPGVDPDRLR